MSELETVLYRRDDAVAIITIHRPDAMNSFNTALRRDLLAAFRRAAGDEAVRVVVLTGEGRSFSAGADLKEIESAKPVSEMLQQEYRPVLECIATLRQPVIAAVGGSAAGIGMTFALACDLLVMADNAFLMSAFSNISLLPDGGLKSLTVTGDGIVAAGASDRALYLQAVEAGCARYRLEFGNGDRFEGPFLITRFQRSGAQNDAELFSMTLESAGGVIFTAGEEES